MKKKSINRIAKLILPMIVAICAIAMTGCAQPGGSPGGNKTYEFTKTVKILPAGTDGTAGTSATYVEFGDWPQSVLPSDSTVTVDETKKVIMGANTYYLGSDGNYYAKCNGRYFKVEPIKWRVLTDNYSEKKLLLAENILTANMEYFDSSVNRTIEGKTVYANNYKHSLIRAYLNGLTYQGASSKKTKYNGNGFLQTAFTQNAQGLIADTEVDNRKETTGYSERTYAAKSACENTTDKIFLLSESEVINSDYGFAAYSSNGKGNARIRFPTDYAKANYAIASSNDDYGGCWWLRSPYDISPNIFFDARYVRTDGNADDEDGVYKTSCKGNGVVPALSISF